ncbi:MAG: DUF2520 domain-containing protein [Actinobacteria bacterium]|nr:DUF2520 domain-containing protein [Actinomycetota bacterium]
MSRMDVAVIGAGRVGTAIAVLLRNAGHRIAAVAGRKDTAGRAAEHLAGVPVLGPAAAAHEGELVLLGVPDDSIARIAAELVREGALAKGQWVAHLSGAMGLDALAAVRPTGARPLAIHPLQTFPDVESAIGRIPGCAIAVTADDEEGSALGEGIARDLGAEPFRLADEARPLYHAAAVFASNYVVASIGLARELLSLAGVPDPVAALMPLVLATVENAGRLGPERALTGPAVRGDAGTVERNLLALSRAAPDAVPAYVAMARVALDLGTRAGRLPGDSRALVEEVLSRWT